MKTELVWEGTLSRWGGLRSPSEVFALKWTDVLWDQSRIMVRSPKLEGIEGRGVRPVPLYPELKRALLDAFEAAEPGAVFVIERHRAHPNLGVAFGRLIRSAGMKVWPKPFHAMRSSRQTELSEIYPAATVAAWMGNSLAVAQAHYLQVRDSHFAAASSRRKAARKAARRRREMRRSIRPRRTARVRPIRRIHRKTRWFPKRARPRATRRKTCK